jgi:thioesterase domain-containing protein
MRTWNLSEVNWLQSFLENSIPPVKDLRFQLQSISGERVEARAPLIENSNHMGTGFGGSLYSVLVLTAYSFLYAQLKEQKIDAEIVIQTATVEYKKPVTQTIVATCLAPSEIDWQKFIHQLQRRGRARLKLTATIGDGEMSAVRLDGVFVATSELNN